MDMVTPRLNEEEAHLLVEEVTAWRAEDYAPEKKKMPTWLSYTFWTVFSVVVGMLIGALTN